MFLRAPPVPGFKTRRPTGHCWGGLYELPDASPVDPSSGDRVTHGQDEKREQ